MLSFSEAARRAIRNVIRHGDTDIFPFPFESLMFRDKETECISLLESIHRDFDDWIHQRPPEVLESLAQVGYTGFRWAAQIEPFWNVYYLALVISIAEEIEQAREPLARNTVFSYRYEWQEDEAKLFRDSTWYRFRQHGYAAAENCEYVVVTDIADFYPRVYHHRLENALRRLPNVGDTPKRLTTLLMQFSRNVSYGLPIGGPASRVLAELALADVDTHLSRQKIRFCRYADDYCIFCANKSEAYSTLVALSQRLFVEGLVLQKRKTKIMKASEFREITRILDPVQTEDSTATDEQRLLGISIQFDPYSDNPEEDYELLCAAVREIDVIGILSREIAKTAIDSTVAKQAVTAIRALSNEAKPRAILTLLDSRNLSTLSPVFVSVMRLIRDLHSELDKVNRERVHEALLNVFDEQSDLISVELNLAYYIQALASTQSSRSEEVLIELFTKSSAPLIRRLIILVMSRWKCYYWLSDIKRKYSTLTEWEKRAVILGSYCLGDEGKHWREFAKKGWGEREKMIHQWYSERVQKNTDFPV